MKALIIDTEVSSLETKECIQIAYWDGEELRGEKKFCPSGEWCYGAIAAHHILPSDVERLEPSADAVKFLPDSDYVVGHNVDFDCEVLGGLPGRKRICTLAMARAEWPELKCHKLGALAYMVLGLKDATRDFIRNSHDADVDVHLCHEVLREIAERRGLGSDWEAIYQSSEEDRVPKTITFGKHAGSPLSDLPSDYVRWLLKLDNLDPYLRKALSR